MTTPERSGLRTAATLGLAVFGPLTLLSGLLTFVTIPTGVPAFLAGVFVFALAGTALCLVVYLVDDARRRV